MARNPSEYDEPRLRGVTWLSRSVRLRVFMGAMTVAAVALASLSSIACAQEVTVVHRATTPESESPAPAPDRLLEAGLGFRMGGSSKATLMAIALDAYVPRYFVGMRADAAAHINILGAGYRETFGRISVGVAHQLPIPTTNLSVSLFAGPTFGSMTLDWAQGWFSGCDADCTPEPHHNPKLGTYFVYGAQLAASLSIHIGGFFVGISGSADAMVVGNTVHLTGLFGSRLGVSM